MWDKLPYANITGAFDAFTYANSVTNQTFTLMLFGGLWIVMFVLFRPYNDEKAFAASSFICALLAGILRGTNQVGDVVLMAFILATAVGAVLLMKDRY